MFIRSKVIIAFPYFVRQIPLEKVEANLWSFFQFSQMFSFYVSLFILYRRPNGVEPNSAEKSFPPFFEIRKTFIRLDVDFWAHKSAQRWKLPKEY